MSTRLVAAGVLDRLGLLQRFFALRGRVRARRAQSLPATGADGLPLPPAELQVRVMGWASAEFEALGAADAARLRASCDRTGAALEQLEAVLDFGAGCGRISRHWAGVAGPRFHACDRDPDAVAWCQTHLPFLRVARNRPEPPLPYADAGFDLVYAYSVFTHLPVDLQHRWIAELARTLRPGGRVLFSAHGPRLRSRLNPRERRAFDAGECVVRFAGAAGSNVCSAFHPRAWVEHRLLAGFELLEVTEAAHGHDLYMARLSSQSSEPAIRMP